MKVKQKKGISLIVLVITIIVMIILAAAIILSLNGSGVIGKAKEGKVASDTANIESAVQVIKSEALLECQKNGEILTQEKLVEKIRNHFTGSRVEGNIITVYEKYDIQIEVDLTIKVTIAEVEDDSVGGDTGSDTYTMYTDSANKKAPIPNGFVVSGATGENTITGGLVIYEGTSAVNDSNVDGARKTRNQFVWVPVDNISEFVTKDGYYEATPQDDVSKGRVTEPYSTDTYTSEEEEYAKMRTSVEKHKGFYIARYEAGNEDGKVVSKKEATVKHIAWGTSMTEIGTEGAVYLSRNLYPKSGTSNVVSTLCYGVQWDAVMNFMKDVPNPYVEGKKYIEDSTGMGWYNNNYSGNRDGKTGIDVDENASNMVKNIYDMAGNATEWTMEAWPTTERVMRGGSTGLYGGEAPASSRISWSVNDTFCFRPALYLK